MRASVILAAHNEGSRLGSTLQSINETCAGLDFEIVLVDDGSTDGSVQEALRRFSRIRHASFEERQGPGPAKDLGARMSEGDTLVFLDAHTKPERGAIRRLIEQVERLQGDSILVPQVPALDVNRWQNSRQQLGHGYAVDLKTFNTNWKPLRELRPGEKKRSGLYESPALIGCAFAISRELYDKLWGQDSQMRGWGIEDIDLGLKAWLMGHAILLDPLATIGHRFRATFDNYQVPAPQVVANQLRMARKNFTETVWTEWVQQARQRIPQATREYPEGIWTRAWSIFEADRASVEEERSYLLGHRVHDEFWYAEYFGLPWPSWRSDVSDESAPAVSVPAAKSEESQPTPKWMQEWSPEKVMRAMSGGFTLSPSPSPSPPPKKPVCPKSKPCPKPNPEDCTCPCQCSSGPVRYRDGQIFLNRVDVQSSGFGASWQHHRDYANQLSHSADLGQGYNWLATDWPYLVEEADGMIACIRGSHWSLWFEWDGTVYQGKFGSKAQLTHDAGTHRYVLTFFEGTRMEFQDFSAASPTDGLFVRQIEPGGSVTEVTDYTVDGLIGTIQRSGSVGGSTLTEAFVYAYSADQQLETVTLRRQAGGSWEDVRRARYDYYGDSSSFGSAGDLELVRREIPTESGWSTFETDYYRYWLGDEENGMLHGLKYVVNPATYVKIQEAGHDPQTASNAILSTFADFYFEYNGQSRVTLERIDGGSRTFTFAYTPGTDSDNFNVWAMKTVETLPDGSQNIVYTNKIGQYLIKEFKSGSDRWIEAWQYGSSAREVEHATPAAVLGYNDSSPTLAISLRSAAGQIEISEYYTTAGTGAAVGYLKARKIKEGSGGTPVVLQRREYSTQTAGGVTIYPISKETSYRNTDETGAIETTYGSSYYSGTVQTQETTSTMPVVSTDQNGYGVAATRKQYFDTYGRLTWSMDERGFISHNVYDLATGALIQQVQDVDTSTASGVPSGWTTPTDGGLNLVTDFAVDDQGRTIQMLGPIHTIDLAGTATSVRRASWTVYDDVNHVTYSASGYHAGSGDTLINPVSITKQDAAGKVLEEIQAIAASTAGSLSEIIEDAGGGSAAFPQSSYCRWTTYQYTDCCLAASVRAYHTIPASGEGASGTNYNETDYGYDVMKRRNRTVTPGGTITDLVYDPRGQLIETYVGTNDDGASMDDPTGGGADPDNNMVIVSASEFDGGAAGGNGNLTAATQYVSASDTRVTQFTYDWRDRRITTDGEVDVFEKLTYDNLNRVVKSERFNTTESGHLIARNESKYDNRGRVYQTIRYGVDPSTGTVGNSLVDNTWYDAAGNVLKSLPAGSRQFSKSVYDSLGRVVKQYAGYDLDETSYAEAGSVSDDVILEQSESVYDAASNVLQSTARQRYHNAPDTQLGALGNPSTTPKARVTYAAMYPDAVGRTQASADYGTNGGTALSRPATIPARSDTVLVMSSVYNSTGSVETTTDPAGLFTRYNYDDLGREVERIANYEGSGGPTSGCTASDDIDVTVQTAYNADGNVSSLTAVNSATGNQVTQYVYGTTLADSGVASSLLKRAEIYPDSTGGSDQITFAYNRQQQVIQVADQAGTVHVFEFDKLGRPVQDRVTTLGSGVDGAVRRIGTTYEVRGMAATRTSYDNATVGSGSIVNQSQFAYNDFGQLTKEYQSHAGAVDVMGNTPKVEYTFADGASNTIRPTGMVYPNSRELVYSYGDADSIDDVASRIVATVDDDDTTLVAYDYLGRGTFVVAHDFEPDVKWTLVSLTGSDDPDTGDIYTGLDRFGRVKDNRWYDVGSAVDVDRIKYGYDRAGNRIWRQNVVAGSLGKEFDELYTYDGIQRLKEMARGTLNSTKTALASETFGQCWTLDSTGNWQGFREDDNGDGTWDLVQARTSNTVNEITDITNSVGSSWVDPAYNAAGNMTTLPQPMDPTQSFAATYDGWNRLVKIAEGSATVSEYAYDGSKRRILQKSYSAGSLTETRHKYYTSTWQSIEERLGTSPDTADAERQFIWGLRYIDDCVLRDRDTNADGNLDERLYAMQDGNWNVTGIVDEAAAVQERYAYAAYGQPVFLTPLFSERAASSYGWESLYCGYRYESSTGVFHVRNRVYHPVVGSWVQRDPLGMRAVDTSMYQPILSRPLVLLDPNGEDYIWPDGPSGGTYCDAKAQSCSQRHKNSRSIVERITWYGCHCGGWNSEEPDAPRDPIDQIDIACRTHDKCYDKVAPPCKGATLVRAFPRPTFKYDPRPECESCDKEFCTALRVADCQSWTDPKEREYCEAYRNAAMETVFGCDDRFDITAVTVPE